jgi:hypothetical protein
MRPLCSVAMMLLLAGPAAQGAGPAAAGLLQAVSQRQLDASRAIVVSTQDDERDERTTVALVPQIGGGVLLVAAAKGAANEPLQLLAREVLTDWSVEGLQPAALHAKHGATAVLHSRHNVALLTHVEQVRSGGEPEVRFAYPPEQTLAPGAIRDDPEHVPRILVAAAVDETVWFLDSTGDLVRWRPVATGPAAEPDSAERFEPTRQAIVLTAAAANWFAWTAGPQIALLRLSAGPPRGLPGPLPTRVLDAGPTLLWPDRIAFPSEDADGFVVGPLPELISPATAAVFGKGRAVLIAGTPRGELYAWELPGRRERWRQPVAEAGPWREVQILPAGTGAQPLALAWQAAAGLVLDPRSGAERARFAPPAGARYTAVLANGPRIIAATMQGEAAAAAHGIELFTLRDADSGLLLERDTHTLPAGGPVQRILSLDAQQLLLIRARAVTLLRLPGDL